VLDFLRKWTVSGVSKPVEDYKVASERLTDESRKLQKSAEECTWDQISRGLIGNGKNGTNHHNP
jgi:hypothetical protein